MAHFLRPKSSSRGEKLVNIRWIVVYGQEFAIHLFDTLWPIIYKAQRVVVFLTVYFLFKVILNTQLKDISGHD